MAHEYWKINPIKKPFHRNFIRIISRKHQQSDILSVLPEEWLELGFIINSLIHSKKMRGGGITLRFGDKNLTSAETLGLYVDVQEPDGTGIVYTTFIEGKNCPKTQADIANIKATAEKGNTAIGIIGNSRNSNQLAFMRRQNKKGSCSFCDLGKMRSVSVKEGYHWLIKPNNWPYLHHSVHLVFIYKDGHSKNNDTADIVPAAWEETGVLLQWAIRKYNISGGALVLRFLDYKLSGCTMRHLHWQLQVPDGTGPARAWFCKPQ
jgi:hypothetical protein